MKPRALIKPLLVAAAMVAGQAVAAPSAQQVLTASPIDDIVAHYPAMMKQGIEDGLARVGQMPPMVTATIGQVVSHSFRDADIEQQIVANLENNLTPDQLASVHDWYKTPVARKIAEAEIAASAPSVWKEIQAQGPELSKKYRNTERSRMFERYDRAARATESAVDTTIAVQLGLATAMSAFSPGAMSQQELRQAIENQRSTLRGVVGQQVFDSYLYTYEDISTQEMSLYLDFLESAPGAAFSKTVTSSIQQAISEPIESVSSQMVRLLAPAAGGKQ
ncbi:DUF2059 domain-containing protein [Marinobacter salinisoli]|uniref:DUF2059 domain-containing protein n=1 Tax=Marinobacter salinisoli TaxID=2769486 RepID=A0ABX7MQV3_9GAMM|nr:DUF2059 domain-containing protein [Marinobacter salinisoli]QSP94707.1 DUF2059 domain-containing protein [Marinobacter salinisoli]